MIGTHVVLPCVALVIGVLAGDVAGQVEFKAVGKEPEAGRYRVCRSLLVGPWKNQPEEYEGYNGFVGWSGIARLRSGRWLVTFTSGTWHATPPWTEEVRKDLASLAQFEAWHKIGMPDIRAPRGGRAHIMHSDDQGLRLQRRPEHLRLLAPHGSLGRHGLPHLLAHRRTSARPRTHRGPVGPASPNPRRCRGHRHSARARVRGREKSKRRKPTEATRSWVTSCSSNLS